MGGASGQLGIEITKDEGLKVGIGAGEILEVVVKVSGKLWNDSGVTCMQFLVGVGVDIGYGGGKCESEDKGADAAVLKGFVSGAMMREDTVKFEKGDEMREAERGIVCLRGLLKEKMMLRRGWIDQSPMKG